MKTLSELRAVCKKHNIKVKKQNLSWGPHISFEIKGFSTGGVLSRDFVFECEMLDLVKKI